MLLHERLRNYRLLPASQSPRRRELLSRSRPPSELAPPPARAQRAPAALPAEEVPRYLARLKSEAYPHPLAEGDILLTADTVVVLDDRVLGKPRDRSDAVAMLHALAGRSHVVVSGVTFRTTAASHTFTARSEVWFRPLRDEEIDYYVDTFRPYDKAGSYGIQEWLGYAAIERIDGSFYNVMGLPIQRLYVELERFLDAAPEEGRP